MKLRNGLLAAVISLSAPSLPAQAGCLPSAEKSLSYCSGVLGMLAEFQSQEHSYFDENYLELIAIVGDKQCGYYTPTGNLTELQWAEFMHNAGKIEFGTLMNSQNMPKLQSLLGECVPLYQAHYAD